MCPVCRFPLNPEMNTLRCVSGHTFDIAREGYVNLIPSRSPGSLQGDSAAMVQARQAFLGRGYYQPLAEAIGVEVSANSPQVVADIGCGEGYYLRELAHTTGMESAQLYGTDISKVAVAAAAKHDVKSAFAVADTNVFVPLEQACVDVAMCVFAPRNAKEFARIVRKQGRLVIVIPGTEHLRNVREKFALIGIENDKITKICEQLHDFKLLKTRKIAIPLTLNQRDLHDLINMTPNARHVTTIARDQIEAINELNTQAHFEILTFTRN